MAVVSNSSPLIALARIQRIDLLPAIFESILIPPAVAREIAPSIPVLPTWLRIQAPSVLPPAPLLRRRLGAGEREDMEDAEETGVSLVSSAGKCPFADASSFFCVFDFAIKDLCKASSRAA